MWLVHASSIEQPLVSIKWAPMGVEQYCCECVWCRVRGLRLWFIVRFKQFNVMLCIVCCWVRVQGGQ